MKRDRATAQASRCGRPEWSSNGQRRSPSDPARSAETRALILPLLRDSCDAPSSTSLQTSWSAAEDRKRPWRRRSDAPKTSALVLPSLLLGSVIGCTEEPIASVVVIVIYFLRDGDRAPPRAFAAYVAYVALGNLPVLRLAVALVREECDVCEHRRVLAGCVPGCAPVRHIFGDRSVRIDEVILIERIEHEVIAGRLQPDIQYVSHPWTHGKTIEGRRLARSR
eukprot:scaffold1746_cov264-Pinguiococcus_pyrenoidosus.AAC.4